MPNNSPIGIFDSGMGGLSVWKALREALPHESFVYFGDGERCPYGPLPAETVIRYTAETFEWLLGVKGVKMVVVACNTATAAAIAEMRRRYPDVPIVGMEPAVKPAALSTATGVVAVLATEGTLKGDIFLGTAARAGEGARIVTAVGEGFVELVENNLEETPEAFETVRRAVEPLVGEGADKLVLGCTHYPFLMRHIRMAIGDRVVEVIDHSDGVVRRVRSLLAERGADAGPGTTGTDEFHTLAGEEYRRRLEEKARQALLMDF